MKIEEIKKLKSGKYKIKIDGNTIITYDDVLLENNVLTKKDIDNDVYNEIKESSSYYDAYYKTVNYITRKMRSEFEIKEYLSKMEIDNEAIKQIVDKLKTVGLINDEAYIKAYIYDSFNLSNDGPNKIKNFLLTGELNEEVIDQHISTISENEVKKKLAKIISKRINNDKKTSAYQLQQKIITDMINLGYDRNIILEIINDYNLNDSDKIKKEYTKLYQKYSKTLDDKNLYKRIREKLYAKGFDINEIQLYMNNLDE